MSSTVQRSFTRVVAPVVLVALLAVLTAWQGGARSAEGRAAAAGGDGTTIAVHGDWTIDVYAADGELVEQRAFTNALTAPGARALAEVMSGTRQLEQWLIVFECGAGLLFADVCWIVQPGFEWRDYPNIDRTLEVIVEEGAGGFTVQGTAVAPQDFTLERVLTYVARRTPGDENAWIDSFTHKLLPVEERIEIMEGQSIVIRVELSFS
jgi:hypothetical protein